MRRSCVHCGRASKNVPGTLHPPAGPNCSPGRTRPGSGARDVKTQHGEIGGGPRTTPSMFARVKQPPVGLPGLITAMARTLPPDALAFSKEMRSSSVCRRQAVHPGHAHTTNTQNVRENTHVEAPVGVLVQIIAGLRAAIQRDGCGIKRVLGTQQPHDHSKNINQHTLQTYLGDGDHDCVLVVTNQGTDQHLHRG